MEPASKGVPNDLFNGKLGHISPMNLIEFGQIGYVTIWKQIKKKWVDKLVKCIMVWYLDDHSGDMYQMYDPAMKHARYPLGSMNVHKPYRDYADL